MEPALAGRAVVTVTPLVFVLPVMATFVAPLLPVLLMVQ